MPWDKSVQLDADGNEVHSSPVILKVSEPNTKRTNVVINQVASGPVKVARARIGHEAISRHQNDVSNRPHDLMNEVRHTPGLQTVSKIVAPVRAAPGR